MTDLDAIVVQPGDTLIVRINPDRIDNDWRIDAIAKHIRTEIPNVKVVVIAADQIAVAKAETP